MSLNLYKLLKTSLSLVITPSVIISQSISLIFRQSPQNIAELLFLQRSVSPIDKFSGDLCFPGGHRELNESSLQTAIRETKEETGIELEESSYVGTLDFALVNQLSKSKKLNPGDNLIGVFVFWIPYEKSNGLTLQQNEIQDFRWINFDEYFIKGKKECFTHREYNIANMDNKLWFPAYHIGMKRELWGLTLFTTMLFLKALTRFGGADNSLGKFSEILEDHCHDVKIGKSMEDKKNDRNSEILKGVRKWYSEERVIWLKPKF